MDDNYDAAIYMAENYIDCCSSIRAVARKVTQLYDQYISHYNIKATQYILLKAIDHLEADTITELANYLIMDRTTLARNLKSLITNGWIEMRPQLSKRAKPYRITEEGMNALDYAHDSWIKAQHDVVLTFGAERYNYLQTELSQLNNVINILIDS